MVRAVTDKHRTSAPIAAPRLLLLLVVFALLLLGFVMVYSTSSTIALLSATSVDAAQPMKDVLSQMKLAFVGVVAAVVVWKCLPCSLWRGNAVWVVWGLSVALLVATAIVGVGDEDWGARRWLFLGPIGLQSSEFAKIALVLTSARLFADFREGVSNAKTFLVLIFVLVLLPVCIILVSQSDLGTAIICVVGILSVMWLGEVPLRTMLIVIGAVAAFGVLSIVLSDYRRDRLMVFLNPWNDGAGGYGTGYQIIHSLYALAGGGFFGVGLGNSHEKYLYLTQSDTDFIFAVIGEELGFVGTCAVIVLFLLFLYAGLRIARLAPDNFAAMIAGGCTVMIVFQAFLNIAMAVGWFPPVGKPLPFISSGGSSLVATLIMVGLILSVSQSAIVPTVYDRRRDDLRVVRVSDSDRYKRTGKRNIHSRSL